MLETDGTEYVSDGCVVGILTVGFVGWPVPDEWLRVPVGIPAGIV